MTKFDQAVFTWYDRNKLKGIISTHVDDFLWAGTPLFEETVIEAIRKMFNVKYECVGNFKYLGLDIAHKPGVIELKQENYVKSIGMIPTGDDNTPDETLTESQVTEIMIATR